MFIGRDSLSDSESNKSSRSSSTTSGEQNDDEEILIAPEASYRDQNSYVQMNKSGNISRKFMLKATLVTMRDRSVIVTVSETDTIGNLQVIIGESMKNSHIDFQSLNFVKAFNITKVSDKLLNLKEDYIVADYLSPDEEVLFEIDSANFWLRIKF